jgi:hypothetical protein
MGWLFGEVGDQGVLDPKPINEMTGVASRAWSASDLRRHVHDGIGAQTDAPLAKG